MLVEEGTGSYNAVPHEGFEAMAMNRIAHVTGHLTAARGGAEASDAELLQRVDRGELSALGALYDRHHDSVRQFLARATADGGDADDLAHETFLALAKIAGRYDGRASARPFLIGIAAQLVRRRRRGFARWAEALRDFAGAATGDAGPTPEQEASTNEELRTFDRALAALSEEKRLVFLMVEREGLSGAEVAEALGIPVKTVWTRLHYARSEIRAALTAREHPRPVRDRT